MQTAGQGGRCACLHSRQSAASTGQRPLTIAQRSPTPVRQPRRDSPNPPRIKARQSGRCYACSQDGQKSKGGETTAVGLHLTSVTVTAGAFLLALALPTASQAAAQHVHQPEVFQLASGDSDFWVNVSRYGRYFITVLSGTAYIGLKPILGLLKRPKTAVAVVLAVIALYLFVSTTVQAMLGVSNPLDYQPSGFFPDNY